MSVRQKKGSVGDIYVESKLYLVAETKDAEMTLYYLYLLLEVLIRIWLVCHWKGLAPSSGGMAWPPRGGARREEEELEGWWGGGQLKTAHQPTGGATLSPELNKNCSNPQYF